MSTPTEPLTHEPPMLDCGTAVRKLWDYLDGNLDSVTQEAVRQHVARCGHCFPHADFGRVILDAVADVRRDMPEVGSVREGVISRLRAEGYDGP